MKKRLTAIFVVLAMCLTMLPFAATAASWDIALVGDTTLYKPMNDDVSRVKFGASLTVDGSAVESDFAWSTDSSAITVTSNGYVLLSKSTANGTYNLTATSALDASYTKTFEITVADGYYEAGSAELTNTYRLDLTGATSNLNSWVTISFTHVYNWAITAGRNILEFGTTSADSGYDDILTFSRTENSEIVDNKNGSKVLGAYSYGERSVQLQMNALEKKYNLYVDGTALATDEPITVSDIAGVGSRIRFLNSGATSIYAYSGQKFDYSIELVGDTALYKPMNDVTSKVSYDAKLMVDGVETESGFVWSTDSASLTVTSDGGVVLDKNVANGIYNLTATSALDASYTKTFEITVADGDLSTGSNDWNYNYAPIASGVTALTNRYITLDITMTPHSSVTELVNIGQSQNYGTYLDFDVSGGKVQEVINSTAVVTEIGTITTDKQQLFRIGFNMADSTYDAYLDGQSIAANRALPVSDMRNIGGKIWFKQSTVQEIAYYSGQPVQSLSITGPATVAKPMNDDISYVTYKTDRVVNWSTNDANTAIDANGRLYLNKNSATSIVITAVDKADAAVKGSFTVAVNAGYFQDFENGVADNELGASAHGGIYDADGQNVLQMYRTNDSALVPGAMISAIAPSGIVTMEFDYIHSAAGTRLIAIGQTTVYGQYLDLTLVSDEDGVKIINGSDSNGTVLGTLPAGWTKVKLELNFDSKTYDLYIGGKKIASAISFPNTDTAAQGDICLNAAGKVWFGACLMDNVALYNGVESINTADEVTLVTGASDTYSDNEQINAIAYVKNSASKSYTVLIAKYETATGKLVEVEYSSAQINGEGMVEAMLKNVGAAAGTQVKVMVLDSLSGLSPYIGVTTISGVEPAQQ